MYETAGETTSKDALQRENYRGAAILHSSCPVSCPDESGELLARTGQSCGTGCVLPEGEHEEAGKGWKEIDRRRIHRYGDPIRKLWMIPSSWCLQRKYRTSYTSMKPAYYLVLSEFPDWPSLPVDKSTFAIDYSMMVISEKTLVWLFELWAKLLNNSWNTTFTWKNNWQIRYSDLGIWQTFSLQWSEKVISGKTTDSICCQG